MRHRVRAVVSSRKGKGAVCARMAAATIPISQNMSAIHQTPLHSARRTRDESDRMIVMPAGLQRSDIARVHELITPYIRRTPVLHVDGRDLGLDACPLTFKLELTQHAGSFKARGAFTNLLT